MCVLKNGGGAGTHKTRLMETNAKEQIPEIFKPKAGLWVKLEQVTLSTSCNSKTKKCGKIRKIRKIQNYMNTSTLVQHFFYEIHSASTLRM